MSRGGKDLWILSIRSGALLFRRMAVLALIPVVFLMVCSSLIVAGCSSKAGELATTLLSTEDPDVRAETAASLAGLGSAAATQQVVDAAKTDDTAAKGLQSLRDEYVRLLKGTLEKARQSSEAPSEKEQLRLAGFVECMGVIGDDESLQLIAEMVAGRVQLKRTG